MSYPFKNLVFEGGGVKGIAYIGALRELKRKNVLADITRVGGTSAGAINAVLLALNYSEQKTYEILANLDFNNFMDDSWGLIRDSKRLIEEYGWYKGDFFKKWMGALIEAKTGNAQSTFNDLRNMGFKDLFLVGTNLSTGYSEVFSAEHTPRIPVVDAVRISMSLPLFFRAIRNFRGDVYVDGGVFNNYPIKLFDRLKYIADSDQETHVRRTDYYEKENGKIAESRPNSSPYVYNKETLGFRLDTAQEISIFRDGAEPPSSEVDDFFDYAKALLGAILNVQNNFHLKSDDWQRTVYVNTLDVGTTDFSLSEAKKKALVAEGRKGIKAYFDWYDDQTQDPAVNHPEQGG